jgi:uncharacterized protein YgbK (DUF1537 family)
MDNIVIIADDLTGAADTGVQFCRCFDDAVLLPYNRLWSEFKAIATSSSWATAVYTNSRALDVNGARRRLGSIAHELSRLKPAGIYKKVDSCLRGNLGAETEAIMEELGYRVSFIAPAFPEMGRTTIHGIHYLYGTPVAQSEISKDPVAPITDSNLSRVIMAQGMYPVAHIDVTLIDRDEQKLKAEIERLIGLRNRHFVFDAATQTHLDIIARLSFTLPQKIILVGSAGLAKSVGGLLPQRSTPKKAKVEGLKKGNHLLVCGTTSEVTKLQIERLIQNYPYEEVILEADLLADQNQQNDLMNGVSFVQSVLITKSVVIRISSPKDDKPVTKKTNRPQIAESIVKGLGHFVASVLKQSKPGFFFVTGGDTADAVLTAVEAKGIRILGEIVTGMVHGIILGGPINGLPIVTKAGAFGNKNALVVLHEIWQKRSGVT